MQRFVAFDTCNENCTKNCGRNLGKNSQKQKLQEKTIKNDCGPIAVNYFETVNSVRSIAKAIDRQLKLSISNLR